MPESWKSTRELMAEIRDAHRRLRNGEATVMQAHAEARMFGAAARLLDVQLEHARLTGRLETGSDVLPDVKLSPDD